MSEVIYLVGQISPKYEETYQWRRNVSEKLKGYRNVSIIDPCSNSFNTSILQENRYAISEMSREIGIDVLPSKDLTYILKSTIAIVNLNQYDKDKELLGTYFEMSWLYINPEKTVIAFADDLNSYKCKHPFVKQTVDTWCKNEDEACYIIKRYFL
jgi:nucleoside 2-deoxyribosyltransferase